MLIWCALALASAMFLVNGFSLVQRTRLIDNLRRDRVGIPHDVFKKLSSERALLLYVCAFWLAGIVVSLGLIVEAKK